MKKYPEQTEIKEWFMYRDGKLIWRVSPNRNTKVGSIAGTKTVHGYSVVSIQNQQYYAHRLIWIMFNGSCDHRIDHINQNGLDNRIENLRRSDARLNRFNSKLNRNNTSGLRGVSREGKRWVVRITVNGKSRFFGSFKTKKEAGEEYARRVKAVTGGQVCCI